MSASHRKITRCVLKSSTGCRLVLLLGNHQSSSAPKTVVRRRCPTQLFAPTAPPNRIVITATKRPARTARTHERHSARRRYWPAPTPPPSRERPSFDVRTSATRQVVDFREQSAQHRICNPVSRDLDRKFPSTVFVFESSRHPATTPSTRIVLKIADTQMCRPPSKHERTARSTTHESHATPPAGIAPAKYPRARLTRILASAACVNQCSSRKTYPRFPTQHERLGYPSNVHYVTSCCRSESLTMASRRTLKSNPALCK